MSSATSILKRKSKILPRLASRTWPRSRLIAIPLLLLGFALLLLPVSPALAQSPPDLAQIMLAANQSYEASRFDQAIAGYETIIQAGIRNSDVYYNLGNAYYKQGDLGRAILNYRRAQRLNPTDSDIAANLNIARAQTIDQLEVASAGILVNLIELAEEWLTLNQAAILALALWSLICVFAIFAIFWPRLRRLSKIVIAILALFLVTGLSSMANRLYKEQWTPPAVIIAKEVNVTSGPGDSSQYLVEFDLHAGAEVFLLESRPGWRRISLPGDLQGWVPKEAVEPVIDR